MIFFKLQLKISASKCDFNMTQCEKFDTFVIRDVCTIFAQANNKIWSDLFEHTQPRVKCPFKAVPIKVTNATMDFSYLTRLPIGGYTWILNINIYKSIPNVRHKKQMLFCLLGEANAVKATRDSVRRIKTNG